MIKVLFIGLVWPEPTSSAAGWRILHLVKLLLQNYEVHFASAASKSPHSVDLSSLGVIEHDILLNDSSFDTFIKGLDPRIVVYDRFMVEEQYGWRVAECVPNAVSVLDTEDLHFLRLARLEALKKKAPINYQSETAKREIASILRCDLSIIISQTEMDLLRREFKIEEDRLFYLPFQEEKITDSSDRPSFEEREHFVFIGNFIHEPNWRTVELLKRNIWPILRKKVPKAELHIYGAYSSEKVNQLHNPNERFIIKGRAEDARKCLEKYKVLLAPIPFGAGAKGKFVDAMFAGTPSITSLVGAENMLYNNKWPGFITDYDEEFAEMAALLYENKREWDKMQNLGFDIFNATVGDLSFSKHLLEKLREYRESIAIVRKKNFIGQILRQQEMNATKYMSLWIEQKNKVLN